MNRTSERCGYIVALIAFGTICLISMASPGVSAQEPSRETKQAAAKEEVHEGKPVSFWMQKKLDFSKNILEGISIADFDKVSQNAKTLRGLSKIESFVRRGTPGYRTQLETFDQSLAEIIRQADKENVEGATLAFNQLTFSCVKCHRELRETK